MTSNPLDGLSIASPCSADWNEMSGDDRVRFCQACQLNVYNLSGMSRTEAEALVMGAAGRLCVRFFRREDGTVLTRDCPVGLKALHRKQRIRIASFAAAVTLVTVVGIFTTARATEALQGDVMLTGQAITGGIMPPPYVLNTPKPNPASNPPTTQPETTEPPVQIDPSALPPDARPTMGEMVAPQPLPKDSPKAPCPEPQAIMGKIKAP